jgi:hypothetical protein
MPRDGAIISRYTQPMTKLLIFILILKIVAVVIVGIVCGALILRLIFEVGATQTSTPRQRNHIR